MTTEQAAEAWALVQSIQCASDRLRNRIGRCAFCAWTIDECMVEGARRVREAEAARGNEENNAH